MPRLHKTRMRIGSTQSGASLSRSCNELKLLVLSCSTGTGWNWSGTGTGAVDSELTLLAVLTLERGQSWVSIDLELRWSGNRTDS